MKRFVLEVVFDESYFQKVGRRKVFRYKTRTEITMFRAKDGRNAKIIAKNRMVKISNVVYYRVYKLTAL